MIRTAAPQAALAIGVVLLSLPAWGQAPPIPINTLISTQASIVAGDMTFSNFQKPLTLPQQVGLAFSTEFNDVGLSAVSNANGSVSLVFTMMDPATGLAVPATLGGAAGGGEFVHVISYSATVTNPAKRMHSLSETFGPLSVTSGTAAIYNSTWGVEPKVAGIFGMQYFDGVTGGLSGPGFDWTFPGGNLPAYNMASEFGLIKGHLGLDAAATLDSFSMNFTLVPAGTAVPPPPILTNLDQAGDFHSLSGVNPLYADTATGTGNFALTYYAQDGGAPISLTSSNPAVPVPPTVTVQQGYYFSDPFVIGPANVDVPTDITLTYSYNGRSGSQVFRAAPVVPLAISSIVASLRPIVCALNGCTANSVLTTVNLNRLNLAPAVVTLTSSDPTICPIAASTTFPVQTVGQILTFVCQQVRVDTPITFSAAFNGQTVSSNFTVPHSTDVVAVGKAELVVKNLSLKADATSNIPTAILTLYNAATGQLIGTMTNTGLSGGGAKYQFQGTLTAPVQTIQVRSNYNGIATGAVAQK